MKSRMYDSCTYLFQLVRRSGRVCAQLLGTVKARQVGSLTVDSELSNIKCWAGSVRALGADTSYDEDQFDPSGRASRVLASTIALMRSEQGLNTSNPASTAHYVHTEC